MAKKKIPPLILEHTYNKSNLIFLTMVEYKKENYLVIVDNITDDELTGFVLDAAEAEKIDVNAVISIATKWFYSSSERYPLSVEFSKNGMAAYVAPILKSFNTQFISRIVGKCFSYDVNKKPKLKRKKIVPVAQGVEIKFKKPSNVVYLQVEKK
jgi:hypothetical protein